MLGCNNPPPPPPTHHRPPWPPPNNYVTPSHGTVTWRQSPLGWGGVGVGGDRRPSGGGGGGGLDKVAGGGGVTPGSTNRHIDPAFVANPPQKVISISDVGGRRAKRCGGGHTQGLRRGGVRHWGRTRIVRVRGRAPFNNSAPLGGGSSHHPPTHLQTPPPTHPPTTLTDFAKFSFGPSAE